MTIRIEKDLIGEIELQNDTLYGVHTARAKRNFSISGTTLREYPDLVIAMATVKKAAALANAEVGTLPAYKLDAISLACDEITAGRHHEAFVVDMIQGGAGTSTNMNANEVIANLALLRLGHTCGEYHHLHPNDDVNRSQSTNDVYPTAIRVAILRASTVLLESMTRLSGAFHDRARQFASIPKVGRTQLQDAVPMTLGSEFVAFGGAIGKDIQTLQAARSLLSEVNLGGTAIGTGINAPTNFAEKAVAHLRKLSEFDIRLADDLIEAGSDVGALVSFSGTLKRIAVRLSKICNDLRLLSSGPRAGLGEIVLPAVQAGSSIMPGKVNPVIPEVVNQVAFQVIGNDVTVTMAAEGGELQLNAWEPIIVFNVLNSVRILSRAMDTLQENCVSGIVANEVRCRELLSNSLANAAALVPFIGYEKAAAIAKKARESGETLHEAAERLGVAIDLDPVIRQSV